MAEKLVAADASPLIGLAAAGAFHLLRTAVLGRFSTGFWIAECAVATPASGAS